MPKTNNKASEITFQDGKKEINDPEMLKALNLVVFALNNLQDLNNLKIAAETVLAVLNKKEK